MKVLKFYADWCQPCKQLSTIVESTGIEVTNINIEEELDAAVEYKIRSVPTCVVLDNSGAEVRRKTGMMTADEFKQFAKV